jgi:energy-coupling factor transporter transmembrane protein EcfT
MSWGGGYPVAAPVAGRGRWVSAVPAALASVLAVAGSSGALVLYVSPSWPDGAVLLQARTGWSWAIWSTEAAAPLSAGDQLAFPFFLALLTPLMRADPAVAGLLERTAMAPPVGAPVLLGAALALVVAVRASRAPAGLAALAAGLLVGGAASIALDAAADVRDGRGSMWQAVEVGTGTWFLLAAALAALVAAVLVARRPTVSDGPLRAPGIGVVLLPLVAAVAVGGCFAPHVVAQGVYAGVPWTTAFTDAGSGYGFDAPLVAPAESAPLLGIPLGVAAVLALLATLLLVLPGGPARIVRGRLVAVGACGMVLAVAAHVWLDLAAALRNAGVLAAAGEHVVVAPGPGAWLVLAAGALAVPVIAASLRRA